MEAILLAGGMGTRLAGRLQGVPKPMAPVADRPFLEFPLGQLERAGCTRAILSVSHLHGVIQEHFGAEFHGVRIDYAVEEKPLGTGGAIRMALRMAREPSVLVLNGDTFLDADYGALLRFHQQRHAALSMAVTQCADVARYGGVTIDSIRTEMGGVEMRVTGFQEKGRAGAGWINAGAYAMDKDMPWPPELPEKFSFETDFLGHQMTRIAPAAYPVNGFFLDIGVPEDLDRAQTELAPFAY
jgi:D-glycero-alpha-D-manno-heptose 1-phosphate guanylyltransferase